MDTWKTSNEHEIWTSYNLYNHAQLDNILYDTIWAYDIFKKGNLKIPSYLKIGWYYY